MPMATNKQTNKAGPALVIVCCPLLWWLPEALQLPLQCGLPRLGRGVLLAWLLFVVCVLLATCHLLAVLAINATAYCAGPGQNTRCEISALEITSNSQTLEICKICKFSYFQRSGRKQINAGSTPNEESVPSSAVFFPTQQSSQNWRKNFPRTLETLIAKFHI